MVSAGSLSQQGRQLGRLASAPPVQLARDTRLANGVQVPLTLTRSKGLMSIIAFPFSGAFVHY